MLSDSNRRTIRTLVHALVAGLTAAPTFLPWIIQASQGTPMAAKVTLIAGALSVWVAIIAFLLNKAEDLGLIPSWLREELIPIEAASNSPVNIHINNQLVTKLSGTNIEDAIAKVRAALGEGKAP